MSLSGQRKLLNKDEWQAYLRRLQQPTLQETVQDIAKLDAGVRAVSEMCSDMLGVINTRLPSSSTQRSAVDGRDGTFPIQTAKRGQTIPDAAKSILAWFDEMLELAETANEISDACHEVHKRLKLTSFATTDIECFHGLIATTGNDLTKAAKEHAFARARNVDRIISFVVNDEYSKRRNNFELYGGRVTFRSKLTDDASLRINRIHKERKGIVCIVLASG